GGALAELGLQTRLGAVGVSVRASQMHDFQSEVLSERALRRRIVSLRLDGTARPPLLPPVPLLVEVSQDRMDGSRALDQVSAEVSRLVATRQTRYALGMRQTGGPVAVALEQAYEPGKGVSVGVTLSLGLGRDPLSGRWLASARPLAASGAATAEVFLDRNANG